MLGAPAVVNALVLPAGAVVVDYRLNWDEDLDEFLGYVVLVRLVDGSRVRRLAA